MTIRLLLAAGACLLLQTARAADVKAPAPAATRKADAPGGTAAPRKPEIPWAKTYSEAVARARAEKKLVMVDVYTDWCFWCKVLDEKTYPDPTVVKKAAQFVAVKINAEAEGKDNKDVAERYKIDGFPTILFLDPAAGAAASAEPAVVAQFAGFLTPAVLAERLDAVVAAHRDFPGLWARVAAKPDDLEALGKLSLLYFWRQQPKDAEDLLNRGLKLDPANAQGRLTKALNVLADARLEAQGPEEAIPLYRKAALTSRDPADAAYARSSIATGLLALGKVEEAVAEFEAITKLEGAPTEDKEQARAMVEKIRKLQERAKAGDDGADKDEKAGKK